MVNLVEYLIGVGAILLIGIVSYSAIQHHLDSKAAKLQHGNDEERQMASDLRDISSLNFQSKCNGCE